VEHDPETKRWSAFFPELPGCASAGDTEEEAVRNAKEALELWFEPAPVTLAAGAKVLEVALTWASAFCSAKDVIRVLRKNGFSQLSHKGSHQKWRHSNGRQVIVATHGNKPIPIGTLKSIIEGSGLSPDDFQ
jgi:predicted RNA binding protein YcfA (HicA-like mRNA interferase family)